MGSDGSAIGHAPLSERLVRGTKLCIGTTVEDYRRLAAGVMTQATSPSAANGRVISTPKSTGIIA